MVDIPGEIKAIEDEMRKTQYNKATEHHFGVLKAKIAKLREKHEARQISGGTGYSFSVKRSGDATVILVGFPSVGKSTLLNALTGSKSATAAYAFTTLTVIPGVLMYKNAKIQILDVPGIIAGAASGTGRGKEVLGVVRNADMVLFVIDAGHPEQVERLRKEVYDSGVRLDESPPNVKITRNARGGIRILTTCKQSISKKTFEDILKQFSINNADIVIRENITIERFIDGIQGGKSYLTSRIILNKADLYEKEAVKSAMKESKAALPVSATTGENVDALKEELYKGLKLIPIYLKEVGKEPDMKIPLIVKEGATLRDISTHIHRDLQKLFKYARLWGPSAKFPAQVVKDLNRKVKAGDIVEFHAR